MTGFPTPPDPDVRGASMNEFPNSRRAVMTVFPTPPQQVEDEEAETKRKRGNRRTRKRHQSFAAQAHEETCNAASSHTSMEAAGTEPPWKRPRREQAPEPCEEAASDFEKAQWRCKE